MRGDAGPFSVIITSLAIILFLSISIMLLYQQLNIVLRGERTEGTIVDYIESKDEGTTLYQPVVEFTNHKGENFKFPYSTSSSSKTEEIDEKITIYYLHGNPKQFEIIGTLYVIKLFLFLLLTGILLYVLTRSLTKWR